MISRDRKTSIHKIAVNAATYTSLIMSAGVLLAAEDAPTGSYQKYAPEFFNTVSAEVVSHGEESLTYLTFLNRSNLDMRSAYLTEAGELLDDLPSFKRLRPKISAEVMNLIRSPMNENVEAEIQIVLDVPQVESAEGGLTGAIRVADGQEEYFVDDTRATAEDIIVLEDQVESERISYVKLKKGAVRAAFDRFFAKGILSLDDLAEPLGDKERVFVVQLDVPSIKNLVENLDGVLSVSLPSTMSPGIGGARASTRVDPFALSNPDYSGSGIGIHMTESTCAEPNFIGQYIRTGGSTVSDHSRVVAEIMRKVSPDAWIYCRSGTFPTSSDLNGPNGQPEVRVINGSFTYNASTFAYSSDTMVWDDISYDDDISLFFAAGNFGNNTTVANPGLAANSTTVGNYNDGNNTIASSSDGNDPATGFRKPEVSAPGTGLSLPLVPGVWSGTSFAAPHVAGIAADLMEKTPFFRSNPAALRSLLIAAARRTIAGDVDSIGEGGVDFYAYINKRYTKFWNGSNSYFSNQDAADGTSDGWVTFNMYLNASNYNVNAVLSWQNRGTYVYNNLGSALPLGSDLNLRIVDPNGGYINCSCSLTSQYEKISFNPQLSGNYKIQVQRASNGDVGGKFDAGVTVSWQ